MKKILFLLLFFASTAHAVTAVSVTDGGGNADTLEGQNGSFYLDAGNITGTLPSSSFDNITGAVVTATESLVGEAAIMFSGMTTVFGNYSSKSSDHIIFANASTAASTIYLPDATVNFAAHVRVKKTDRFFNTVTIDPYQAQTINGNATDTLTSPDNSIMMISDGSNWEIMQRAVTGPELNWSSYHFVSGASGTYYSGGGFYHGDAVDTNLTQASPSFTHGSVNEPAGAHMFWVFGGFTSVPDGTVFLNISGTSVDDDGNMTDEEVVLIADMSVLSLNDYSETTQKWLGQVKYKLGCTRTCTTYSADGNTGHSKYADFQDNDFTIRAIEVIGEGGAADTGFDICVKHHDGTGWTYTTTGFVPGNGDLACLSTDYGINNDISSGGLISWDRNLDTLVRGATDEGLIIEITTTANNSIRSLDIKYGIVYE